jgi:hypothetical protein
LRAKRSNPHHHGEEQSDEATSILNYPLCCHCERSEATPSSLRGAIDEATSIIIAEKQSPHCKNTSGKDDSPATGSPDLKVGISLKEVTL